MAPKTQAVYISHTYIACFASYKLINTRNIRSKKVRLVMSLNHGKVNRAALS